jgi:hypothetical protein
MLDLKTLIWKDLSDLIESNHPPSPRDKLCCWQHRELYVHVQITTVSNLANFYLVQGILYPIGHKRSLSHCVRQ